jgi:hypothetical protein
MGVISGKLLVPPSADTSQWRLTRNIDTIAVSLYSMNNAKTSHMRIVLTRTFN